MFSWMVFLGLILFGVGRGLAKGTSEHLKSEQKKKPLMSDDEKGILGLVALGFIVVAYVLMTMGITIIINQV